MVRFFVQRPVFAGVIAILITLAGAASIRGLPVEWYPNLALPQVVVTSVYTGASAEVVESSVTAPLEEAINGAEGMRYIESTSSNDGVSSITITFDRERDLDLAAVDVQNRVSTVLGRLPAEVRALGVDVRRSSSAIILGLGLYAKEGAPYDSVFISNYADRYIRDELRRIEGVGEVRIFGERKYAMRLWVDPVRLAAHGLSPNDVVGALREQNVQVAAGQLGRSPAPTGQMLQIAILTNGRLVNAEQFEDVVVQTTADGGVVRFRDIGRVELGAESYAASLRFNEREAVGLGVFQLPSGNALEIERRVKERMEELATSFPAGLEYRVAFNPTTIVEASIEEVLLTLLGTIVLVVLVIYAFLQRAKTTLIPALTIPVSLIGTFAFVKAFDFSLNVLTLFGLTLATGLVVDDAIVVVENIERNARLRGGERKANAIAGTKEVFGAVLATSLVLIAVFVPPGLFPGTTGVLYQQFALTIAFSIALSSIAALTLAPALSGLLLDAAEETTTGFFGAFNRGMEKLQHVYERTLRVVLRHAGKTLAAFVVLIGATVVLADVVPTGFVPSEDQGYFITVVQAPPGTSLQETDRIMARVERVLHEDEDVGDTFAVLGFSFEGTASNRATIFSAFRPRDERHGSEHEAAAIVARLRGKLGAIPDAIVVPFEPPPVRGVGNLGGFEAQIVDRGNAGLAALQGAVFQAMGMAAQDPDLSGVFSTFSAADPQLQVSIDRDRARALGVPVDEALGALQVLVGSAYVNDFELLNRSYRVFLQAEGDARATPEDLGAIYVRSRDGQRIPLSVLLRREEATSPQIIKHFNMLRAATLNGGPSAGRSSGEALAAIDDVLGGLPAGFGHEFSGLSLEQREAGSETVLLFGLGLLLAFLVLAAQYESVSLPFVVLTAVPTSLLGALVGLYARGLVNDVFAQIGLLLLVGLASKNAVLIVEFAHQRSRENPSLDVVDAAIEASVLRLRPILMTSFAFILGILPLVFATGASEFARRSLGTTVFAGMLVSTVLNSYFVPVLYVLVVRGVAALRRRLGPAAAPPESIAAPAE